MMVAISTAISLVCAAIPFLNFPWGGGFTFCSMLPIVVASYMYGVKWGLFTGGVYAAIQMVIGASSTVIPLFTPNSESYMGLWAAIAICIIDYIFAYTALGLGGIFRNKIKNRGLALCLGAIAALSVRYICHITSGVIFYGSFAEWFFGDVCANIAVCQWILENISGTALAILYSIAYNGCYMIPEIAITAIAAYPISKIPYVKKS